MPKRGDPVARRRVLRRTLGCVVISVLLGTLLGAVAGSMVPIVGTFFGAMVGTGNGLLCAAVVAPLIAPRGMRRSFTIIGGWSLVAAAVSAVAGFAMMFHGLFEPIGGTLALVGAYGLTTGTYLGTAIWCGVKLPDIVALARRGFCPGCGYELAGLDSSLCPECGQECGHDHAGTPKG